MKKLTFLLVAFFTFLTAQSALAADWKLDKAHTNIGFTITHMVITDVQGKFTEYDGTVTTKSDDDFSGANINVTIQTVSINTENEKRDGHLKSPDFFDAAKNPVITYKGKKFEKVSDSKYKMVGDLTMNGVTKEVTLDAKYRGMMKDPWGNTRAGFKATATIDRYDWNLKYNSTLDAGGLLIGQELDLVIDVELIKK